MKEGGVAGSERQQHMLFDIAKIRRPDERRAVVAEDVIDVPATLAARHCKSLHPRGRMLRSVLFVEMLCLNALRVAFQSQRSVAGDVEEIVPAISE